MSGDASPVPRGTIFRFGVVGLLLLLSACALTPEQQKDAALWSMTIAETVVNALAGLP